MRKLLPLFLFLGSVFFQEAKAQDPLSGVYTINALQPTAGRNFQTFNDAVTALTTNGIATAVRLDVVEKTGPYNEQVIIPAITGASVANTITINGNGEKLAFVATVSSQRATLKLDGADYVTIYNLAVDALGNGTPAGSDDDDEEEEDPALGYGIQLIHNADYNTIRKCTIHALFGTGSATAGGILLNSSATTTLGGGDANCDYNTVDSNVITGGYVGISCSQADIYQMKGNRFTNNTIKDFYAYGFYLGANADLVVANNDISRPAATTSYDEISGFWFAPLCVGIQITGNRIHNMFDAHTGFSGTFYGMTIRATYGTLETPNYFTNNAIYNIKSKSVQYGIQLGNSTSTTGIYSKFYHNTILLDDVSVPSSKKAYGLLLNPEVATGIEVVNNILSVKRAVSTASYSLYITSPAAVSSGLVCNYNDFITDADNSFIKLLYCGMSYESMALWQQNSGQDANSVSIAPAFQDVAAGDLTPTELSLNDKGTNMGVKLDIRNRKRNRDNPDIGAYEFVCITPSALSAPDSIAVCAGSPAVFAIKDPQSGIVYEWYASISADAPVLGRGTEFTTNPVPSGATLVYYTEAVMESGCSMGTREKVKAIALDKLNAPAITTAEVTGETALFTWTDVGAKEYRVSRNYIDFIVPSSGATGLFHKVTGLKGGDTLSLVVKALGYLECQTAISDSAFAKTLTYNFFVPNMFTPNGDGQNDELLVYGRTIQSMKLMIFSQWGEKVFETNNQQQGWNGYFKGKPATVGVYMYVLSVTHTGGFTQAAKGSISLIR